MTPKRKQFSPHIYAEWGELFDNITSEERSEILLGITKFPEYEPKNTTIWNFIKSQIEKDYELFIERCQKNGNISRSYWQKNKSNDNRTISNDIQSNTNGIERYPKHKQITDNELQITDNELQITNNIPTKEEILDYVHSLCKKINVDDFIAHYEASNWCDKYGLPINWKQKAIIWANNYKEPEVDLQERQSQIIRELEEEARKEGRI